jgi:membrane associated rhomboid family serine protease
MAGTRVNAHKTADSTYLYYMIFPYGDDNSQRKRTPFVTYALIVANIVVFVLLQGLGSNDNFTYAYSTVPAEIITGKDIVMQARATIDQATGIAHQMPPLHATPIPVYLTLITSVFMHGGIAHIFGNMLYLFIFGDNIESLLGHTKYLIFYLLTGIIASMSHVLSTYFAAQDSLVPCLGASGAISGIMGAYLCMFPQNKVRALLFYFPITIPAYIALGVWIAFQLWNGFGAAGGSGGGVAYAAHIGGFIAGFLLIRFFGDSSKTAVS